MASRMSKAKRKAMVRKRILVTVLAILVLGICLWSVVVNGVLGAVFLRGISSSTNTVAGAQEQEESNYRPAKSAPLAEKPEIDDPMIVAEFPEPPSNYDQNFVFVGGLPAYTDMRAAVREPGDRATFLIDFGEGSADDVFIQRVVADDHLLRAEFCSRGGCVDILSLLDIGPVSETMPADADLRATMEARGVNVVEGEILAQNYNAVNLGPIELGDFLVFEVEDDVDLQVNRGLLIVLSADADAYTVSLTE